MEGKLLLRLTSQSTTTVPILIGMSASHRRQRDPHPSSGCERKEETSVCFP